MARVLGTIITLAAAVVVNVVPGLGQLASAAILVGAAAVNVAINALFAPKSSKPDTAVSAQKQPIPPRIRAFGRSRLHGYFSFYETNSAGKAMDAYAFADVPSDGVEFTYLADEKVTIIGNVVQATVDKKYQGGNVQAGYTLGAVPNTAFTALTSITPNYTANYRGDGIVTGYLIKNPEKDKYFTQTYPQGDNFTLSLVARWGYQYDPRDPNQHIGDNPRLPSMWSGGRYIGSWKWTENPVLHLLWYLVFDRGYSYEKRILPAINYWITAANVCDEVVPTLANAATITVDAPAGRASLTLSQVNNLSNGTKVTVSGVDYTVTSISGTVIGITPSLQHHAAVGQGVTWVGQGGEARYRSCVTYAATSAEKEVLASIIQTFDGWMQERGDGAFVLYAGKVYTPTVTIGPDEIINANLQLFVETENTIDQVKVTYISAEHDFSEVEATPWGGENGATRIGTMDAQTPSFSQNRRLAKRVMDRTNSAMRGSITTTLAGRAVRGQRYINLNYTESDVTFFSGLVEITKLSRNFETGGLDFDWIAIDPNIDSWNPATEEGQGAAIGDIVALEPLTPPTITSAVAVYDQSAQDATGTRVAVTVNSPLGNRSDLTWYMGWKKTTSSVWKEDAYTDTDPGDAVVLTTDFVPSDTSIDFRVEYKDGSGQLSGYSAVYTLDTSTDATAPDPATSVTLTNWSDTLDLVTDYIARARSYRWQFYASDGTTLIRTLLTSDRTVSYTSAQAAADGARRSYIVSVAGINGAGAGTAVTSATLTLNAPPAVTGVSATGGASNAEIDFDLQSGVAGYSVAYSTAANFNPLTQGSIQRSYGSPTYLQGLAAGTFYTKVAAFDAWTDRPDLLNYSTPEQSFVITTGGGGTGGGGGGGGGGYCPVEDECILMANDSHDGPGVQIAAGSLAVGQFVWTQPDIGGGRVGDWGAYEIEAVEVVDSDDVWLAMGFKATAGHKTWLSSVWNRHDVLGSPVAGTFKVVRITVKDAHTYVCAGVLSHNIKQSVPYE